MSSDTASTPSIASAITALPDALRAPVAGAWDEFAAAGVALPARAVNGEDWRAAIPRVWAASDFVRHSCVRFPALLVELATSGELFAPGEPAALRARLAAAGETAMDEAALARALRLERRREMVRLAFRDLAGWATLDEVLASLSALADAALDTALARLDGWWRERHGTPRGSDGRPVGLVVLGMGKLGGNELNFSSDIDLIFAYRDEGETDGPRPLTHHEYFVRLGQALIKAINESTEDGFVFRVDMRLRPNGQSGPLALSFEAMEQYYQLHGRDWERYAFIKARACAGDAGDGAALLDSLRPFVFRKYLDYGALESIRSMKQMIEAEMARKGMTENIKLGRGGIREIEFIAQALQLLRGGREPALQMRTLRIVLPRLVAAGYLDANDAHALDAAYVFLRNLEHRLQMVDDRQTQLLPEDDAARSRIAFACGFGDWPALMTALDAHRAKVHALFAALFRTESEAPAANDFAALWAGTLDAAAARALLAAQGYRAPDEVIALLQQMRAGAAYQALSVTGRERTDKVVPLALAEAARSADPDNALRLLVQLLEAIGRRTAYFVLLAENLAVMAQLVRLGTASPWIANWIARHPLLLDELLNPRLEELPSSDALRAELHGRLAQLNEDDEELAMEVLREFRHAHLLRVAATDIGPGLDALDTGRALAALAETVLVETQVLVQRSLERRHGAPQCEGHAPPGFAIIGYGKLGSRELGYGSDLDIIFLYEGCEGGATSGGDGGERSLANEQFFARLGQRILHTLTARTPGGILYEVDTRLRPSGKSGLLVSSLEAFERYQRDEAWTWEHQALVRARPVAGSPVVAEAFGRLRHAILTLTRDPEKLRADVLEMRRRMREAKPESAGKDGQMSLKHGPGGIVDIEFMVQYWTLRWAHDHPALTRHTSNVDLLAALAGTGCIAPEVATQLTQIYRRYLSLEHRLKLAERGSFLARDGLGEAPETVRRVWQQVFNEE